MNKNFFTYFFMMLLFTFSMSWSAFAQTTLSGKVTDEAGEGIPGVNVKIEGSVTGGITNTDGVYKIETKQSPPFRLVFTFVGFKTKMYDVEGSQGSIDVQMEEQVNMGEEVVISASRVEESIMESPVTVEKMDIQAIKQGSSADFYDGLNKIKGVYSNNASLTFNSINTRGFASGANTRFVQLIDGMDNSSAILNFAAGNIAGVTDLDIESLELVPGAASALYGPNAFNGLLMMRSKSPFEYQGLSVDVKAGVTMSNTNTSGSNGKAHGTNPYSSATIRYAKSFFNNKLAFKVNLSYLQGTDWSANDYQTYRSTKANDGDPNNPKLGAPNFDGMNLYGDETNVAFSSFDTGTKGFLVGAIAQSLTPSFAAAFGGNTALANSTINARLPSIFAPVSVNRTGIREDQMLDNYEAKSIKLDGAVHWRITEKLELSYVYRYGTGATVYQGADRYALRDFGIQYHKIELKNPNFFVRAYASLGNAGNSYNLSALGAYINETIAPTSTVWLPNYLANYAGYLLAQPGVLTGAAPSQAQIDQANAVARTAADASRGTADIKGIAGPIRNEKFKRPSFGAGFIDDSRFYHAEFNYNFGHLWKWAEVQVGANFRRYDLFTNNTVLNENTDGTTGQGNKRITIDEFGMYTQWSKKFFNDRLKLTASVRYDKNQNFDGQTTPRVSVVYSAGSERQHNFRASYQTGFRNPAVQDQFIFFPSSAGNLLGSTKQNAQPFGIHEGGARDANGVQQNIKYVQPEQLTSYEVGYKGLFANKLFVDINAYYSEYQNFIAGQTVFSLNPNANVAFASPTNPTGAFPAGTAFRPYINSTNFIKSYGVGIGANYRLPRNLILSATYNYADYEITLPKGSTFEVGFNSPKSKFTVGIGSKEIFKNFGFDLNYRWQSQMLWESSFATGQVDAFGVFDMGLSYRAVPIKTVFKLGANNLLGSDYRNTFGGPYVGQLYYVQVTFDQFFR